MRKEVILVTGAAGEMGQALITHLSEHGVANILALDVNPVPDAIRARCQQAISGDILDESLMSRLISEFAIPLMYHLAALLSTRAEFTPEAAHRVNVDGTLRLLQVAVEQSGWLGKSVTFIFPSSVAAYGLPDLETKARAGAVKEHEWNIPTTMYGCNKLYCEHLGRYYARHYRQLAADTSQHGVDFRSIRFPGLISAFVREDTRMPFMAMPDAVKALTMLEAAPRARLTNDVYNIASFNPSAGEIRDLVAHAFPGAAISFEPDAKRQAIVDSWPLDQNDEKARRDWGWSPDFDQQRAFDEYLIPNISRRYHL
jgi:threonine 3-dehydrogenase